jgi:hypothetical protein
MLMLCFNFSEESICQEMDVIQNVIFFLDKILLELLHDLGFIPNGEHWIQSNA